MRLVQTSGLGVYNAENILFPGVLPCLEAGDQLKTRLS